MLSLSLLMWVSQIDNVAPLLVEITDITRLSVSTTKHLPSSVYAGAGLAKAILTPWLQFMIAYIRRISSDRQYVGQRESVKTADLVEICSLYLVLLSA